MLPPFVIVKNIKNIENRNRNEQNIDMCYYVKIAQRPKRLNNSPADAK